MRNSVQTLSILSEQNSSFGSSEKKTVLVCCNFLKETVHAVGAPACVALCCDSDGEQHKRS